MNNDESSLFNESLYQVLSSFLFVLLALSLYMQGSLQNIVEVAGTYEYCFVYIHNGFMTNKSTIILKNMDNWSFYYHYSLDSNIFHFWYYLFCREK